MRALCIFSTYLTLGIRTKDLHAMVRSRKPVVVPIECPNPTPWPPLHPPPKKLSQNLQCRAVQIDIYLLTCLLTYVA